MRMSPEGFDLNQESKARSNFANAYRLRGGKLNREAAAAEPPFIVQSQVAHAAHEPLACLTAHFAEPGPAQLQLGQRLLRERCAIGSDQGRAGSMSRTGIV